MSQYTALGLIVGGVISSFVLPYLRKNTDLALSSQRPTVTGWKSIFDFKSKRSNLAVLGFYLFYVIIYLVLSLLLLEIANQIFPNNVTSSNSSLAAQKIRATFAPLYCAVLYTIVFIKRKTWQQFGNQFVIVLCFSGVFAALFFGYYFGILCGFILPTLLIFL